MKQMMIILFTMLFTENYVLVKFLGICPFLGVSKNLSSSLGMSGAVVFVMGLSSAATWCVNEFILVPLEIEYLKTASFILVIAALVQLVEITLKKFMKPLYRALGIYLPLITTNCAVLGVALLNIQNQYSLAESVVGGIGAGLGFTLAMVLFSGVRRTLMRSKPPKAFEGLPITLVAASITSLTFMGFAGVADKLFK